MSVDMSSLNVAVLVDVFFGVAMLILMVFLGLASIGGTQSFSLNISGL